LVIGVPGASALSIADDMRVIALQPHARNG